MHIALAFLFSVAGFAFLWKGADWLVEGSSKLALAAKVSPIVVGVTVVAFGTSLPEMAVSLAASVKDQPEITLGNVVGSNIANILLVLGIAAVIRPLRVDRQVVTRDTMLVLGSGFLLLVLAMTGALRPWHGLLMLACFVGYLFYYFREALEHADDYGYGKVRTHRGVAVLMVGGGITCILLGSDMLVDSAVFIAEELGISPALIGLTMIAIGTSLPEMATSAVASRRGESDISIGNVLGSNVFNTLLVLGLATFLVGASGISVDAQLLWDILLMSLVVLFLVPTLRTGHMLTRGEGALMLVVYLVYIASITLRGGYM